MDDLAGMLAEFSTRSFQAKLGEGPLFLSYLFWGCDAYSLCLPASEPRLPTYLDEALVVGVTPWTTWASSWRGVV